MKRTLFVCAALLLVGGFATGGQAQVCLDFSAFADGLELFVSGDRITGFWRNYDGDGSDSPVFGIIRDGFPLPCNPGNPAKAGVACLQEFGCTVFGWDWYFLLDRLDGTMQSGLDVGIGPPGACAEDELHYQIRMGPCPFGPDGKGSAPGLTLQQAVRARLEQQ